MSSSSIEKDLISEIKLDPIQAKVYLLVTCNGKMSSDVIAEKLNISLNVAQRCCTISDRIRCFY